jgi:hypothetical protein
MSRASKFLSESVNVKLLADSLNSPGYVLEGPLIGLMDRTIGSWDSACTEILEGLRYNGGRIGALVCYFPNAGNTGILCDTDTWTEAEARRLLVDHVAAI